MRYDPEALVARAGLDAGAVVGFLFENYPSFFGDAATDDLAAAAGYFSDAALLAHRRDTAAATGGWDAGGAGGGGVGPGGVAAAAAASVAARGALFANAHPAPRAFQPVRAPTASLPARAAAENAEQLALAARRAAALAIARGAGGACGLMAGGPGEVAARVLPFLEFLKASPAHAWLAAALPARKTRVWQGALHRADEPGAAAAGAAAEAAALAASLAAAGLAEGGGGGDGQGQAGEEAAEEIEDIED